MADDGGAAGGINCFFRAVLTPGDEVICPNPYFVEYGFYAGNSGGVLKPVPTKPDFDLDIAAMEAAITPRTRVVLINSPNNPTGMVYSKETLTELAARVDITLANLSILKTGKAKAIRFSTLEAICTALDCQPGDLLVHDPSITTDD